MVEIFQHERGEPLKVKTKFQLVEKLNNIFANNGVKFNKTQFLIFIEHHLASTFSFIKSLP